MTHKNFGRYLFVTIPIILGVLFVTGVMSTTQVRANNSVSQDPNKLLSSEILLSDQPPPEGDTVEKLAAWQTNSVRAGSYITPTIYLRSRVFQPTAKSAMTAQDMQYHAANGKERLHLLVQLDYMPRQVAQDVLADNGLHLLAYVPDYAWIASVQVDKLDAVLATPGVAWVGELTVEDKLDPAIRTDQWGTWNSTGDGTVAVYVVIHKDEPLALSAQLVETYGGRVMGEVVGINLLIVEMPKGNLENLVAEDAIQWIEPAAPPLAEANDGIRAQIGVDILQTSPYNLDGDGVDVLIYDGGRAGAHVDYDTRLISGDTSAYSEHATHVAGIVGGSGANSAALQWRGMAPSVDLISYGIGSVSGIAFYEDPSDIEADYASAQNTYGADIANLINADRKQFDRP